MMVKREIWILKGRRERKVVSSFKGKNIARQKRACRYSVAWEKPGVRRVFTKMKTHKSRMAEGTHSHSGQYGRDSGVWGTKLVREVSQVTFGRLD